MSEWRTIESAPKDGTLVILTTGKHTGVGRWSIIAIRDTLNDTDIGGKMIANFAHEYGWRSVSDKNITGSAPTHWMPLPEPPA